MPNLHRENAATNLSIGFSVNLPVDLTLCPPLSTQHQDQKHSLVSSPGLQGNWRSVWTDQPPTETAIFIKALGKVDTRIAAYDTPLDTLLVEELNTSLGQRQSVFATHAGSRSACCQTQ